MYDQSAKAYAKINNLVNRKKPVQEENDAAPKGLLGRMMPRQKKEETKEATPTDYVVDMVRQIREKRMEFKNG